MNHNFQKDISGCGLSGIINKRGIMVPGEDIIRSIALQKDRGNGLGAGYAGYGIYPEFKDSYAFHIMYDTKKSLEDTEDFLKKTLVIKQAEDIPTKMTKRIQSNPLLRRYFVNPNGKGDKTEADDTIAVLVRQ